MSEKKGKLVTCNRCGKAIFLALTSGSYNVSDGFEPLPNHWMYETQIGHLCPECAKIFQEFIRDFMGPTANIAVSWTTVFDRPKEG